MGYAVLFPGQGSQAVGMGADVFAARPDLLGDETDRILGWPLARLCADGPEEELTRTDRAQPALFAVAYALWEAFAAVAPEPPAAAAGHSLGEYTALAAAGVLGFADGLRLVAARGAAMAEAAALEPSGMAALLGADPSAAEALAQACRDGGGRLWVANVNAPGQVVVAGGASDLEWAAAHGREHGVRRVIPLKVAGAFHSPFMAPAASALEGALAGAPFGPGAFPVWANATAAPYAGPPAALLGEQMTSPVRFHETLAGMASGGITTFVHIGPGDVTAGLARRSIEDGEIHVVSTLEEAAAAAEALAAGPSDGEE
ncbi:MAG: ACP S-malonyltransferase [Actinobacteria bacterium]|nr:ACP S-malonyltransferase [Actinomycetota bacterium]